MMRRGGIKLVGSVMNLAAGQRLMSTATVNPAVANMTVSGILNGRSVVERPAWSSMFLVRSQIVGVRNKSTAAVEKKEEKVESEEKKAVNGGENKEENRVASYWGVEAPKWTREDGTEWKWNCFRVRLDGLSIFVFF